MKKSVTTIESINDTELIKQEKAFLDRYLSAKNRKPLPLLLKMCRGYYNKLIISAVFCVLQLSLLIFIPIATANIIDAIAVQNENTLKTVIINFTIAAFLLLINYPMQNFYLKMRNDAMRSIEVALRGAIITKLQRLTIQFNKEMESGRIHSKIIRDVEAVRNLIFNLHTTVIHIVVNLSSVITVLLLNGNWQVLIFFAVSSPVFLLIRNHFRDEFRRENRNYRKTMEDTNAKVVDMVNLIPITKAHALEDYEIKKMSHHLGFAAKAGFKVDEVNGRFGVANFLLMQVFQFFCLVITVILTLNGKMTIGQLTLCNSYFSTFLNAVSNLVNLMPTIASGTEAINSVGEILESEDIEDNKNKKTLKDLRGEFDFKNVRFGYRDDNRPVLKGLDLHINAGETIALVGESGSGKSTIVNFVTGFYLSDSGTVTVDGVDIKDLNLKNYRKNIAMVPQNSILFTGTIKDNITYGMSHFKKEELDLAIERACLTDVINSLPDGIDTMLGENGMKLSGGQRQRVSIARALIRNPKIIILDEATSALDTVSEKHIQTAIENLSKDKTTFIVAHRLSTVKNADKIAVIRDGRCVEFGTYDELIAKKGEFYNFRELQV